VETISCFGSFGAPSLADAAGGSVVGQPPLAINLIIAEFEKKPPSAPSAHFFVDLALDELQAALKFHTGFIDQVGVTRTYDQVQNAEQFPPGFFEHNQFDGVFGQWQINDFTSLSHLPRYDRDLVLESADRVATHDASTPR
jgi:hypothetical protein